MWYCILSCWTPQSVVLSFCYLIFSFFLISCFIIITLTGQIKSIFYIWRSTFLQVSKKPLLWSLLKGQLFFCSCIPANDAAKKPQNNENWLFQFKWIFASRSWISLEHLSWAIKINLKAGIDLDIFHNKLSLLKFQVALKKTTVLEAGCSK